MEIGFDPAKRDKTLCERGLDFVDAARVFAGATFTLPDDRFEYGEARFQTFGVLNDRMVIVVWTEIEDGRRVVSMRKCDEREQARYRQHLG